MKKKNTKTNAISLFTLLCNGNPEDKQAVENFYNKGEFEGEPDESERKEIERNFFETNKSIACNAELKDHVYNKIRQALSENWGLNLCGTHTELRFFKPQCDWTSIDLAFMQKKIFQVSFQDETEPSLLLQKGRIRFGGSVQMDIIDYTDAQVGSLMLNSVGILYDAERDCVLMTERPYDKSTKMIQFS